MLLRGTLQSNRPSNTARSVAVARSSLDRSSTPEGDPTADARLSQGMRARAGTAKLLPYHVARTQFFDGETVAALHRGVRQIVLLGAGYDGRALRFRQSSVRYFEVDHPATQADKRRRLEALGSDLSALTLIAADFNHDDVGAALQAAGHDRNRASLFMCEGVLMYLREDVIHRLLQAVVDCSSADSLLAVSLSLQPSNNTWRSRIWRRITHHGEPPRTILPPGPSLAMLEMAGWHLERVTDPPELPGHALFVTASPDLERRHHNQVF